MRTLIFAVLLTLTGCAVDPIRTDKTDNSQIQVETLFTKDGCTAYRFTDDGRHVYYVRCGNRVETAWNVMQSHGKSSHTEHRQVTTEELTEF